MTFRAGHLLFVVCAAQAGCALVRLKHPAGVALRHIADGNSRHDLHRFVIDHDRGIVARNRDVQIFAVGWNCEPLRMRADLYDLQQLEIG
jgi:hypothetical protein